MNDRRSTRAMAVAVAVALTASLLALVPLGPANALPSYPDIKPALRSVPAEWNSEMDGRPSSSLIVDTTPRGLLNAR